MNWNFPGPERAFKGRGGSNGQCFDFLTCLIVLITRGAELFTKAWSIADICCVEVGHTRYIATDFYSVKSDKFPIMRTITYEKIEEDNVLNQDPPPFLRSLKDIGLWESIQKFIIFHYYGMSCLFSFDNGLTFFSFRQIPRYHLSKVAISGSLGQFACGDRENPQRSQKFKLKLN